MSKLGLMLIVTSLISTASVSAEDLSFDISQLISRCRQPDGTQHGGLCLGYVQAMASAVAHEFVLLRVDDKVEVLENPLPAVATSLARHETAKISREIIMIESRPTEHQSRLYFAVVNYTTLGCPR